MKANELTIGSLIKTNKGEIIKVESISTKRQHRKVGYHKDGDCYHIKYVILAQCEPILLTEEILKVNEFECDGSLVLFPQGEVLEETCYIKCWCRHNGEAEIVDILNYDRHFTITLSEHIYVHEFQHALRLCGLNDLADNLKLAMEE